MDKICNNLELPLPKFLSIVQDSRTSSSKSHRFDSANLQVLFFFAIIYHYTIVVAATLNKLQKPSDSKK